MQLLRFIDWLIALPDDLEEEFDRRVEPLVKEESMPYVTSWERRAKKDGIREGLLEGIELGLELRFGKEGLDLMPRVRAVASVEGLRELKMAVRDSAGLQAFAAALARIE